jgi:hypothetical protein
MTALVAEALALAEQHHITIALVGGDRLSWESRGPAPGRALKALRAAKVELVDLLTHYQLDSSGALAGDGLLADLRASGFAVRRYNRFAGIDDDREPVLARVPAPPLLYAFSNKRAEYSCALRALGAQDCLAGLRETDEATKPETAESIDAAAKARDLIDRVRDIGFRAYVDRGALLISDTTGQRRDLSRFISPALVFETLNRGLDEDPSLLDQTEETL